MLAGVDVVAQACFPKRVSRVSWRYVMTSGNAEPRITNLCSCVGAVGDTPQEVSELLTTLGGGEPQRPPQDVSARPRATGC